jgi:TPR repeat protein
MRCNHHLISMFFSSSNRGTGIEPNIEISIQCYEEILKEAWNSPEGPEAALQLGRIYHEGIGVPRNIPKALEYWERAVSVGNIPAKFHIGLSLLTTPENSPEQSKRGFDLLLTAAEAGHLESSYCIGWCYRYGRGVEPNYITAAQIFSNAAKVGHQEAFLQLALMLREGLGVERNEIRAWEMLYEMADKGRADAMNELGFMFMQAVPHRERLVPNLQAKRDLKSKFLREMKQDNSSNSDNNSNTNNDSNDAQTKEQLEDQIYTDLALIETTPQEKMNEAIYFFRSASVRKYVPSLMNLALLYIQGNQVAEFQRNLQTAKSYLEQAISLGSEDAPAILERLEKVIEDEKQGKDIESMLNPQSSRSDCG